MEHQHEQQSIEADDRANGPFATAHQLLEIAQRKTAACRKHMELMETAGKLFPDVHFDELSLIDILKSSPVENDCHGKRKRAEIHSDGSGPDSDNDLDGLDLEDTPTRKSSAKQEAYQQPVPLPSRIRDLPRAMDPVREFELELRIGEANDALASIREGIAYKSYTYLENIRPAKSKVRKTRGWTTLKTQDDELKVHVRRYKECRKALVQLRADAETLERYKVLSEKEGHLRTVTAIAEPNARGQMSEKGAWFWGMDVAGDAEGNPYMSECACL